MNPYRKINIALDFDRSFTSDVDFWRLIVHAAVLRGHQVYCVTGRTDCPRNRKEVADTFGADTFKLLTDCVFCNHAPKRQKIQSLGYRIDVWIDDLPEGVGAADKTVFKQLEEQFDVCETLPIFGKKAVDPATIWIPPSAAIWPPSAD